MSTCCHAQRTVPSNLPIKAKDSQEIVGVANIRICLACGQVEGTISNGSLFNPSGNLPLSVPPEGSIGDEARRLLGLS